MVYNEKLAVALKVGGKVLRESNDTVFLPFGAEYSVLIKNLSTRRVQVKIDIDGSSTSDGQWFVIAPNSSTEIERFLKNGNLQSGNRFKFIERTSEIEDHRGIKIDDGLIRVTYQFEKEKLELPEVHRYPVYEPYAVYPYRRYWPYQEPYYPWFGPTLTWANNLVTATCQNSNLGGIQSYNCASTLTGSSSHKPTRSLRASASSGPFRQSSLNDAGITVPGRKSDQTFTTASWFNTEDKTHVLILKLKGAVGETPVEKPVEVVRENKCSTCGKSNKSSANYCQKCGTALVVY